MSESKLVSKKKRNVSEVEMAQTANADAIGGKSNFQELEDDDGFAKPKGVLTRDAIAKHLAFKLKIANNVTNVSTLI